MSRRRDSISNVLLLLAGTKAFQGRGGLVVAVNCTRRKAVGESAGIWTANRSYAVRRAGRRDRQRWTYLPESLGANESNTLLNASIASSALA
jgi:hypothetical protein